MARKYPGYSAQLRLAVLLGVIGQAFATPVFAQAAGADRPRSQPAQRPAPGPKPLAGAIEFAPNPFALDAVGLSMRLPLNAGAQTTSLGSRASVQVSPSDNTWLVNIQTPQTTNPAVTSAETANSIAIQVMKGAGETYDAKDPTKLIGVAGKVLEPCHDVNVNGLVASRLYVAIPNQDGSNSVRGYTVFKTTATQFVTFELLVSEAGFAKARLVYESMVATAEFRDPNSINNERAAAIGSTLKVLENLDEKSMRELVAAQPERWERMYHTTPSGSPKDAIEMGYRRIRLSLGNRESVGGEIKGGEEGVVVHLDARYLPDARPDIGKQESRRIVDSQSTYFVSFDRRTEVWNIRMAIREGKQIATSTEVGARDGKSMTVQIDAPGRPKQTIKPLLQGEGYLSRVESLLLPQILIRSGVETSFGSYAYRSEGSAVQLRRDTLEQPSDRPGLYRLTTRFAEDKDKSTVSIYNEKGMLIRTELPDGTIAEPISFEQLLNLWKSKHLATD